MKKYFMFATVAIAALFASCSSSDDFVAPKAAAENVSAEDGLVPIKIGVDSHLDVSTRGTGTVGGVVNDDDAGDTKKWHGQFINVYMFHKGTLNLATERVINQVTNVEEDVAIFDNQLMITPGSTENKIPGNATPTNQGEAMVYHSSDASKRGVIKYYPQTDNYDFFGYHGDDAFTTAPALNTAGNAYEAAFTINGSQDLMSTKAVQFGTWTPIASETSVNNSRFFSAYSARRGVQPNLNFDHLLTRLQFFIKAGDADAAGVVAGVQPDPYDDTSGYLGVYVDSIEIFSRTTGNLVVAWSAAAEIDELNGSPISDVQQIRANKIKWPTLSFDATQPNATTNTCGWVKLKQRPASNQASDQLVDFVQVAPVYDPAGATDADKFKTTSVGEALIVSKPVAITISDDKKEATGIAGDGSGDEYFMRVSLSQKVKSSYQPGALPEKKSFKTIYNFSAPEGETAFKLGYSYKVVITLYGAEEIKVNTTIAPWDEVTTPIGVVIE